VMAKPLKTAPACRSRREASRWSPVTSCSTSSLEVAGTATPLDRGPEEVHADVLAGYVSVAGAREDYGVVVQGDTLDAAETARAFAGRCSRPGCTSRWSSLTRTSPPAPSGSRRVARVSPDFARRLGVAPDDLVEYVNPTGGHVARLGWFIDDSLEGDASPARSSPAGASLDASLGRRACTLRRPFTYVTRRSGAGT